MIFLRYNMWHWNRTFKKRTAPLRLQTSEVIVRCVVRGQRTWPPYLLVVVQVEVVGGVHALVHPPLVPGQSALHRLALRGRQHHKLLQVIELDLRGRSALLEGERSTVIIIIIIIRSSSLIGCQSLSHGTELSPGGRACHYHCDNHHHHRHHHR